MPPPSHRGSPGPVLLHAQTFLLLLSCASAPLFLPQTAAFAPPCATPPLGAAARAPLSPTRPAALGLPLRPAPRRVGWAVFMSVEEVPEAAAAAAGMPDDLVADEEEQKARVASVIEVMMKTPEGALEPAPKGSLPPDIYEVNMEALLNEPVYKAVMYARLEQCVTEEELHQLEIVDELLLDVKKRQRDAWNKEKLEIILGAALEGPTILDDVLSEMREARALDDDMVDFLDALTEQASVQEPSIPPKKKRRAAETEEDDEAPREAEEGEPMLVNMLRIIKDRIVAEIRTRDKPYVRMLAVLLRMESKDEREALLRSTVLTEEAAQMFESFTLDGIQYMEQHRADWLADERVEKMKGVAREVAAFRKKMHAMKAT
eukprot:CAMPEP_0206255696 /NCGR_PEP_ID=MMETSP0047_2-20121206/24379_1 /ASSEMBLY_ACC=CAM_ASM_000192 /TAXON_ID=195065 /ORGANISM="Chroomonas mesostigmatica_cf, Strain CCMP1168" /LENGTH=374 /DNA_ID=CAMNT_0053682101 /DNA_START=39 /DNA_END=1163 /DNA_ORIENTATION=-